MRFSTSTVAALAPLLVLLPLLAFAPATAIVRADDEAVTRWRISRREPGFVRLPADILAADAAAGPDRRLRVTRGGQVVPILHAGDGTAVFLARDVARPTSAWAVYEISLDTTPEPQPPEHGAWPAAAPSPRPLVSTRRFDQDVVHGALAGGRAAVYAPARTPTWFLGSILPGRRLGLELGPRGAAPDTPQHIEIDAWGTHVGALHLGLHWDGRDLGIAKGQTAAGGTTYRWQVPPNGVPTGPADLDILDLSPPLPPPPPQDVSDGRGTIWVDRISLVGKIRPQIDETLRAFDVPVSEAFSLEVAGAPDTPAHLALIGPDGRWLGPAETRRVGPLVVVPPLDVPAGTRLFAQASAAEAPARPAPSSPSPLQTAGGATHVVIVVPQLLESARHLSAHRRATGTPSAVVPLLDIYGHYAGGEHDPAAIRRFLLELMAREAPLEYVVLVGDATLDRTDMIREVTIPAPMARTIFNGATAADRLYTLPPNGAMTGGPSIGRLPFNDAAAMEAWVNRLIRYETAPQVDPSRRLMRFVTSEGRFGPFLDRMLEGMFQLVVTNDVPPAYDMEVTFAAPKSARLWPPPELNAKVIDGFNEGCLFYTYVGHGFARGFDTLRIGGRRFPILNAEDVERIDCRHTPPAVFVFACTTAIFDLPGVEGVGEMILANPKGPIAYWGATRICHPAANTLIGRALARTMAEDEGKWRLGQILDRARDQALAPADGGASTALLRMAINTLARGADADRLVLEASWMYELLGDPATRVAFPRGDVTVEGTWTAEGALDAKIRADLPDGTVLHVSVESPRNRPLHAPTPIQDPLDPASFEAIRDNHRLTNDLRLVHEDVRLKDGTASVRLALPANVDVDVEDLILKAWATTESDVHQGAVVLPTR